MVTDEAAAVLCSTLSDARIYAIILTLSFLSSCGYHCPSDRVALDALVTAQALRLQDEEGPGRFRRLASGGDRQA